MDNIVVADKQSAVATQSAWGNVSLNGPGVVQMPVSPDKVATVTQRGQDLIVTLKSGEKVTIGNFFAVDQAGVGSDIVFVGEDGTLWHANYDAAAFTGFTFDEVASLDELVAGIGVAGSAMPTWAIAGLSLLGIGGAAAAADSSGGGSSGSSDPGDTTAPATPIDLLVSPDGLRLTGRGEAGTTVNIRDAAGNLIGSGTVGADGSFNVSLTPPQINSENLQVTLTDGAGNVSAPGSVTAPDATAPVAPTELAINEQGPSLTGRAEPGSTVAVRRWRAAGQRGGRCRRAIQHCLAAAADRWPGPGSDRPGCGWQHFAGRWYHGPGCRNTARHYPAGCANRLADRPGRAATQRPR